jgi:hypothetical protein
LGGRVDLTTSQFGVAWGQAISGREDCDVPFRLIVTEDDLVAYTTPVGYSQLRKGSQGDLFNVTRLGRVMFLSDIK